jgi:protein-cysteine N-palmitoyltransferase HHAT
MNGAVAIEMPTDLRNSLGGELNATASDTYEPRKGILRLTVGVPSSYRKTHCPSEETRLPPRWRSPEFLLYYVAAAIVIPVMIWLPVVLSSCKCAQEHLKSASLHIL